MDQFLTTTLLAIESGAVYGSLALAVVIVYRTSGLLNFAQGEMAMFGIFLAWEFGDRGLPVGFAMLAAVLTSFLLGAVVEKVVVSPTAKRAHGDLPVVIVTIGLLLAVNGLAGRLWGRGGDQMANPFPDNTWEVFGTTVEATTVGIVVVLLVEVAVLWALFQRTKIGLGMRAVASNRVSSALVGVPVGRMLMVGWGLAAAVGTIAGILRVASTPSMAFDPNIMFGTLVFAFAAATLGGYDSPVGAVVGGFIVAFVEQFAEVYVKAIGPDLSVGAALVVILVVLLVRPQGLFGTTSVVRV